MKKGTASVSRTAAPVRLDVERKAVLRMLRLPNFKSSLSKIVKGLSVLSDYNTINVRQVLLCHVA